MKETAKHRKLAVGLRTPAGSPMQMGRDGKVQLSVYDPDGTRVEFVEFTPDTDSLLFTFYAASSFATLATWSTKMEASHFPIGYINKTYYRDSRYK